MATNKPKATITPAQALNAALTDLKFDGRAAFAASAPAPMKATDVDKILDDKAIDWDKSNRHIKAMARRIWLAGGPTMDKADKAAEEYVVAHPLMKGNSSHYANRILDAVIGGATWDAAVLKADALTKEATEKEISQKGFNRGHQMMADSLANLGLSKARLNEVKGLLENLGKEVR